MSTHWVIVSNLSPSPNPEGSLRVCSSDPGCAVDVTVGTASRPGLLTDPTSSFLLVQGLLPANATDSLVKVSASGVELGVLLVQQIPGGGTRVIGVPRQEQGTGSVFLVPRGPSGNVTLLIGNIGPDTITASVGGAPVNILSNAVASVPLPPTQQSVLVTTGGNPVVVLVAAANGEAALISPVS